MAFFYEHPELVISIHALREEGDLAFFISNCVFGDFYPRPPRGGRLSSMADGLN